MDEIVNKYHEDFPKYSKLLVNKGVIEGIWVMGNNYTTKTDLYGAYPIFYPIIFMKGYMPTHHILLKIVRDTVVVWLREM